MLRPPDRPIPSRKILHAFPDLQRATAEFDGSLEAKLGELEVRCCCEAPVAFRHLIRGYRTLGVHG